MATTVKTGVASTAGFQKRMHNKSQRDKLHKNLVNKNFANSLMMDVLKEEEELGKEISFFDYIDYAVEHTISTTQPRILTVSENNSVNDLEKNSVTKSETNPINSSQKNSSTNLEVKSDNISNFNQILDNNSDTKSKSLDLTSIYTQVTEKSVQVNQSKLLLDQHIDEYVVPDLSYWFEDEWDDICERNSLLMPKLNEITARAKNSMKSISLHEPSMSLNQQDLTTVPLYQAVNFVNELDKNKL